MNGNAKKGCDGYNYSSKNLRECAMADAKDNLFELTREIAYEGKLGRKRREFCESYIRYKKEYIEQVYIAQNEDVRHANARITCDKGCRYCSCCYEYVDAQVQEIEAIVHYLYRNENVLKLFLKKYPKWLARLNENASIYQALENSSAQAHPKENEAATNELMRRYYDQHLFCPFLEDNSCLIYEVRPFTCAGYYVTTPLEWCAPDFKGEVPVGRNLPIEDEFQKMKFYYNQLEKPGLVFMPKAVYELLEKGYLYLASFKGLEGIEREGIPDKKLRNKYRQRTTGITL